MRRLSIYIILFVIIGTYSYGQFIKVDSILTLAKNSEDKVVAARLYNNALNQSDKIGFLRGRLNSLYELGALDVTNKNQGAAIEKFLKVSSQDHLGLDSASQGWILYANWYIANLFHQFELYDLSIEFRLKTMNIAKAMQTDKWDLSLLNSLSNSYINKGDYSSSVTILNEMLERSEPGERGHLRALNGFGIVYRYREDYEKAIYYYSKLKEYSETYSDNSRMALALHNLGDLYHQMDSLHQALDYYDQALAFKMSNEGTESPLETFIDKSKVQMELGKYDEAIISLENAVPFLEAASREYRKADLFELLADAYRKSGNSLGVQTNDSIATSLQLEFDENQLSLNYLTKKEELQSVVANYYAELETERKEVRSKNIMIAIILGLSTLVILMLSYHFYTRFRTRKMLTENLERIKWDED